MVLLMVQKSGDHQLIIWLKISLMIYNIRLLLGLYTSPGWVVSRISGCHQDWGIAPIRCRFSWKRSNKDAACESHQGLPPKLTFTFFLGNFGGRWSELFWKFWDDMFWFIPRRPSQFLIRKHLSTIGPRFSIRCGGNAFKWMDPKNRCFKYLEYCVFTCHYMTPAQTHIGLA